MFLAGLFWVKNDEMDLTKQTAKPVLVWAYYVSRTTRDDRVIGGRGIYIQGLFRFWGALDQKLHNVSSGVFQVLGSYFPVNAL